MLLLHYPKCITCQNARKWLDVNGFSYNVRDIREENPTYDELKEWHIKSGLPLKRFFNTSGLIYKAMGLKDNLKNMTEDECLKLLSTNGMLLRRPILVEENRVLVGFKVGNWQKMMLN